MKRKVLGTVMQVMKKVLFFLHMLDKYRQIKSDVNRANMVKAKSEYKSVLGERGGSVVECRTPEREVRGSRPTAAVLCP